jgi:hypothetical protein
MNGRLRLTVSGCHAASGFRWLDTGNTRGFAIADPVYHLHVIDRASRLEG